MASGDRERNDGQAVLPREANPTLPSVEVDLARLPNRTHRLVVASREEQQRSVVRSGPCGSCARCLDGPESAQRPSHAGESKERSVGHRGERALVAKGRDPRIDQRHALGHSETGVIRHEEHSIVVGEILEPVERPGPHRPPQGRQPPVDVEPRWIGATRSLGGARRARHGGDATALLRRVASTHGSRGLFEAISNLPRRKNGTMVKPMAHPLSESAKKKLSLRGTFTAIVTPFTPDGEKVDHRALDALVEAQIAGGVSGLVPCGTTGESPTLTDAEQVDVVRRVVEVARGRVPVLAGTGSFSTKKTVAASKAAVEVGADGVMVVMPYYSKPSQDGLRGHVLEVAAAVDVPIVLYNVPARTMVDLLPETTEQICAEAPRVVGMKEATGNVLRCQELVKRLGDRLMVLSGDDALTLAMMAVGAKGVISVTSNVRPRDVSRVTSLFLEGKLEAAQRAHFALLDLHAVLFVEPNPAPAKAAVALSKMMSRAVRGPLAPCTEALEQKIATILARLGDAA